MNDASGERTTALEESEDSSVAELQGVSVSFGGVRALTDVSIRIPPRSIIGLIGPNGAGKTTLLGVLSGLIRPDCGRITLAETDVAGNAPETFARRGVSRTFQHADLFAELTVRDHLVLASRSSHQQHHLLKDMLGLTRHNGLREEDFEIDEMMRTLGIDLYSRHLPSEIPLGTRRLVEIAQAILGKPRLILLDEPSAGLDRRGGKKLRPSAQTSPI